MVRRWEVRVPVLVPRRGAPAGAVGSLSAVSAAPGVAVIGQTSDLGRTVAAVQREAGEVVRAATAAGETVWSATLGAPTGVVRDSGSGWPVAGAGDAGPSDTTRLTLRLPAADPSAGAAASEVGASTAVATCAAQRAVADARVLALLRSPPAAARDSARLDADADRREAARKAHVLVQLAFDTAGRPETSTMRVLRTPSDAAAAVARGIVAGVEVPPREPLPGCRTRQVLTLPVRLRRER